MSLDYHNSLIETVRLLRSPANTARLAQSIKGYQQGETMERATQTAWPLKRSNKALRLTGLPKSQMAAFIRTTQTSLFEAPAASLPESIRHVSNISACQAYVHKHPLEQNAASQIRMSHR